MNNRPDANDLLAIARQTLLDELLPQLPDHLRYPALMVANAMAIAGRESVAGAQVQAVETEQLLQLPGELPASPADARPNLCRAIRQGRFDSPGAEQEQLLTTLSAVTRARLAISNPKALAQ